MNGIHKRISLVIISLLLSYITAYGQGEITGDLIKWHPLTISFAGPQASEMGNNPNPFLGYRLQVMFIGPEEQTYNVPGFFDGDGNGGGSGTVWRVRFTPDQSGQWSYEASFRSGNEIAIDLDPGAGEVSDFNGESGSFEVADLDANAPGFLKWGRLDYVGGHYFKFRDGPYWIKGGADSPENYLAYQGFDGTEAGDFGLHAYAGHVSEWETGDPDWGSGDGRGIIGTINYLSSRNVNSIYMLLMNIGGDGKDVWPFAGQISGGGSSSNDNLYYDISKLSQWEMLFAHIQKKGLALHFVLNEAEEPNKRELDNGELGTERKLFHREMMARFGHHLAIIWNLSEEYDLGFNLGPDRIKAFAGYLKSVDPYGHHVTVHNWAAPENSWSSFFGDSLFNLTSIQYHPGESYDDKVEELRRLSIDAGRPIAICMDEFDRLGKVDNMNRGGGWPYLSGWSRLRKAVLWPILLSGGQVEYITEDLLDTEDFSNYEGMWEFTWYARRFMQENLPFWEMEPADDLLSGENTGIDQGQVLALEGDLYAVYLSNASGGGNLDLSDAPGDFELTWYNPRTGELEGTTADVTGGGSIDLPSPPTDPDQDWALLIRNKDYVSVRKSHHLNTEPSKESNSSGPKLLFLQQRQLVIMKDWKLYSIQGKKLKR
jgi:hypothetical protein